MRPVRGDGFVGAVAEGGSVNFRDVAFNPHGHCTHTECLGHITPDVHPVDPLFRNQPNHLPCQLLTVRPQKRDDNLVIDVECLAAFTEPLPKAVVVRTLPNDVEKKTRSWSYTNPPYFTVDFMEALVRRGVEHLLVDLPSVDREVDEGRLRPITRIGAFLTGPDPIAPSQSSSTCLRVSLTGSTCFISA